MARMLNCSLAEYEILVFSSEWLRLNFRVSVVSITVKKSGIIKSDTPLWLVFPFWKLFRIFSLVSWNLMSWWPWCDSFFHSLWSALGELLQPDTSCVFCSVVKLTLIISSFSFILFSFFLSWNFGPPGLILQFSYLFSFVFHLFLSFFYPPTSLGKFLTLSPSHFTRNFILSYFQFHIALSYFDCFFL